MSDSQTRGELRQLTDYRGLKKQMWNIAVKIFQLQLTLWSLQPTFPMFHWLFLQHIFCIFNRSETTISVNKFFPDLHSVRLPSVFTQRGFRILSVEEPDTMLKKNQVRREGDVQLVLFCHQIPGLRSWILCVCLGGISNCVSAFSTHGKSSSGRHRKGYTAKGKRFVFQLTGIVAVTGVNNAKHVVSGRLLFTVPVLVDKSGGAAPLPQLWEHLPLNTHSAVHHHPHLYNEWLFMYWYKCFYQSVRTLTQKVCADTTTRYGTRPNARIHKIKIVYII